MLRLWRLRIQEASDDDLNLDLPFFRVLATDWIAASLPGLAAGAVTEDRARTTVGKIAAVLDYDSPDTGLELQLLGQPAEEAEALVTDYLVSLLAAACRSNMERREGAQRTHEMVLDAQKALKVIKLLRFRLERLSEPVGRKEESSAGQSTAALPHQRDSPRDPLFLSLKRYRERVTIPRDWVRQGLKARASGGVASDLRSEDLSLPMRWLHPIFVKVMALPANPGADLSDRLETVANALDRLEEKLCELSRDLPTLNDYVQRLSTRSPKAIAHATVDLTAEALMQELRRVRLDLLQRQRAGFAYQTAYCEALNELRSLHQSSLIERLVRNLHVGACAENLDQLFAAHDNEAFWQRASPAVDFTARFTAPEGRTSSPPAMQFEPEQLIRSYLSATAISGSEGRRLLGGFGTYPQCRCTGDAAARDVTPGGGVRSARSLAAGPRAKGTATLASAPRSTPRCASSSITFITRV